MIFVTREFSGRERKQLGVANRYIFVAHSLCAFENPRHRVVVTRRHGIELVIVATGTSERHAHERLAHRIKLFVGDVHFENFFVLQLEISRA